MHVLRNGIWRRQRGFAGVAAGLGGETPEYQLGAEDTVLGVDDFTTAVSGSTGAERLATRMAAIAAAQGAGTPHFLFGSPAAGNGYEFSDATDTIETGGYNGNPFYRITIRPGATYATNPNISIYSQLYKNFGAFTSGTERLIFDGLFRYDYPRAGKRWLKGPSFYYPGTLPTGGDRTEFSVYHSSASLSSLNVNPQSRVEIWQIMEDFGAYAPTQFKRWEDITGAGWLWWTMVLKASSEVLVASDGIARLYINGVLLIDASAQGLARGFLEDRQSGVDAASTNPRPGSVGDKYSSWTGANALKQLPQAHANQFLWPVIVEPTAAGGGGTMDLAYLRARKRAA